MNAIAMTIFGLFIWTASATAADNKPDFEKICREHYGSILQGSLRNSCLEGTKFQQNLGISFARLECRLSFGDSQSQTAACLLGTQAADEEKNRIATYKDKLTICREQYPPHTEIDAYLLESCLTGVHLHEIAPQISDKRCSELSTERSFVAPCEVGVILDQELKNKNHEAATKSNLQCTNLFDHQSFHTGYRACLNARALETLNIEKTAQLIKNCQDLVSNKFSESERAACIIGFSLHRRSSTLATNGACPSQKLTFDEREAMGCLTGQALLEMGGKVDAEKGCKELFNTRKSRGRAECLRSLNPTEKSTDVAG